MLKVTAGGHGVRVLKMLARSWGSSDKIGDLGGSNKCS